MSLLKSHLLQRVPLHSLEIPDKVDAFEILDTLDKIRPHNPYYVKQFLARLVQTSLIDTDTDEYEQLYTMMGELVLAKPKCVTETELISYTFDGGIQVHIYETPRLISGQGTTGLRTWEAALFLSSYLISNPDIVMGKNVLELGAGTGVVGISLVKSEKARKVTITDGDSQLIGNLNGILLANDLVSQMRDDIDCHALWWGRDTVPEVDLIVAADVTYDSEIIPSLVECISEGLNSGVKEALVAATVRNENTTAVFEEAIITKSLKWKIISNILKPSDLNGKGAIWYADSSPEIRVYSVSL